MQFLDLQNYAPCKSREEKADCCLLLSVTIEGYRS